MTGEPVVYTAWTAGDPKDPNQNCVALGAIYAGLWADRTCATPYAFICERP